MCKHIYLRVGWFVHASRVCMYSWSYVYMCQRKVDRTCAYFFDINTCDSHIALDICCITSLHVCMYACMYVCMYTLMLACMLAVLDFV